jgi:hypothetical protein
MLIVLGPGSDLADRAAPAAPGATTVPLTITWPPGGTGSGQAARVSAWLAHAMVWLTHVLHAWWPLLTGAGVAALLVGALLALVARARTSGTDAQPGRGAPDRSGPPRRRRDDDGAGCHAAGVVRRLPDRRRAARRTGADPAGQRPDGESPCDRDQAA